MACYQVDSQKPALQFDLGIIKQGSSPYIEVLACVLALVLITSAFIYLRSSVKWGNYIAVPAQCL